MTSTTPRRYNPTAIQRPGRRRPGRRWSLETQMGDVRPRCTVASLRAVGIEPHALPEYWWDVTRELDEAGVAYEQERCGYPYQTLGRFVHAHPTGRYILGTDCHAMALVDGVLVDTAARTSARKVTEVIRVLDERQPIEQAWQHIARFVSDGPSRLVRYTAEQALAAQGTTTRRPTGRQRAMHPVRRAALDAKRTKGHKGGRPNARRLTDYELRAWLRHLYTQHPTAGRIDLRDYALWVQDISVSYKRWDAAWAAVVGA